MSGINDRDRQNIVVVVSDRRVIWLFILFAVFVAGFLLTRSSYLMNIIRQKKYARKIERFKKILLTTTSRDEMASSLYMIGKIYEENLEDYAQAIIEYRKVVANYPDSVLAENAQFNIARCWEALGNLARAQIEYRKVVTNFPKSVRKDDALFRIGEITSKLGSSLLEDLAV